MKPLMCTFYINTPNYYDYFSLTPAIERSPPNLISFLPNFSTRSEWPKMATTNKQQPHYTKGKGIIMRVPLYKAVRYKSHVNFDDKSFLENPLSEKPT